MLKYLLFEHKNMLMREQHLINICVCLSGILLTDMCFNSLPPKLIILENRKIPVSNKMCYLPT